MNGARNALQATLGDLHIKDRVEYGAPFGPEDGEGLRWHLILDGSTLELRIADGVDLVTLFNLADTLRAILPRIYSEE